MSHRFLLAFSLVLPAAIAQADPAAFAPQAATPLRPLPKATPLPVFDECTCAGTVFVRAANGTLQAVTQTTPIQDVLTEPPAAPRDTCPSGAQLTVRWHSEPHPSSGFRYKLVLPSQSPESVPFIEVGKNVQSFSADLGALMDGSSVRAGRATFILGVRGPGGEYLDSTRTFAINHTPDTWWSGPDRNSPSLFTKPNGERYALLVGGQLTGSIVGSLMSPDSTIVLPSQRPNRRTFLEIWKDTVWVRQEDDTVHANSWVILHNGGLDRDSPYAVKVSDLATTLPGFPGGPVLEPGPANGSPIGFRFVVTMSLTPYGQATRVPLSGLYPIFDPADVFHLPRIAGYHPTFQTGRAFAVVQAQDGDGDRDRRIQDGRNLVLRIENGTATPEEVALRPLVLTFEVNRPPYFVTESPVFRPQPQTTFTSNVWDLRLVANDDDPYAPGTPTPPGGPGPHLDLRRSIKVHGKDAQGNDFTYVDPRWYVNVQNINIQVPAALAAGPCVLEVELCDCELCEDLPGTGRCVVRNFPVTYAPAALASNAAATLDVASPRWSTALLAPYPNPTTREASIPFTLARSSEVALEIYDLRGHRVRSQMESLPAGSHSRTWSGMDERGRRVAAGLYFVRLKAGQFTATRKLLVAP